MSMQQSSPLLIKYTILLAAAFGIFQLGKLAFSQTEVQKIFIKEEPQNTPYGYIPTQVTFKEDQKNPFIYFVMLGMLFAVLGVVYIMTQQVQKTGIYQSGEQILRERGLL